VILCAQNCEPCVGRVLVLHSDDSDAMPHGIPYPINQVYSISAVRGTQ